jgi:16S rRNA (cytidine1402-2'-O)-methyltransferase
MSAPNGKLYLVPNTLDFGLDGELPSLEEALAPSVIRLAARLEHWVVENAKSARLFLKRVGEIVPLSRPLQEIQIVELPRPAKGRSGRPGKPGGPSRPGRPGSPDSPREPGQAMSTLLAPAAQAGSRAQHTCLGAQAMSTLLAPAAQGHDLGLLSEAGLPAVADPGAQIVQLAHAHGIEVVALPGASSLLLALAASGLNGQGFSFVGYLPSAAAERAARIRELETQSQRDGQTRLMIETPYRNQALFDALVEHLRDTTMLSVSCGLTLAKGFSRTQSVAAWRTSRLQLPGNLPAVFLLHVPGHS